MGFDLYGERPKNKTGEYFRNNVWYWRPLWAYILQSCGNILSNKDALEGSFNNGHWIHAKQAQALYERLTERLKSGHTRQYAKDYKAWLKTLPPEKCQQCKGTGKRREKNGDAKCYGCSGRGTQQAYENNYPFTEDNVREFAEFCRQSGGFRIS